MKKLLAILAATTTLAAPRRAAPRRAAPRLEQDAIAEFRIGILGGENA